jgi:RNA polymerase sigma-70 factor (ECF subfamily)
MPEETPRDIAREKLAQAFQRNRERLLRLAEHHMNPVLRRRVSPEDVVQEAAAEAYRWGGAFLENDALPAYFRLRAALLQTITHLERRHLQSAKRDAYREAEPPPVNDGDRDDAPPPAWDDVPDTATSPLSAVARADRHELLRRAMRELASADRQIVLLRNFDDLSNAECADVLGIDPKAASIRYVRALQRLKARLVEYTEFRS